MSRSSMSTFSPTSWGALLLLPAVLIATACGGADVRGTPSATPSGAAAAPSATAPRTASPPPGGPPPAQLVGTWSRVTDNPSLKADLILDGSTRYHLESAGGDSFGNVAVNGSKISFYEADPCDLHLPDGVGTYQWTLSGGVLHLAVVGSDPCGRVTDFDDQDYKKKS